jgi:hypothetical protein
MPTPIAGTYSLACLSMCWPVARIVCKYPEAVVMRTSGRGEIHSLGSPPRVNRPRCMGSLLGPILWVIPRTTVGTLLGSASWHGSHIRSLLPSRIYGTLGVFASRFSPTIIPRTPYCSGRKIWDTLQKSVLSPRRQESMMGPFKQLAVIIFSLCSIASAACTKPATRKAW